MRKFLSILSCAAILGTVAACNSGTQEPVSPQKQEREFMRDAIRHHSPDVQKVEIIGNTLVYTHIFDGIIDVKTYTYDGDVCVEA